MIEKVIGYIINESPVCVSESFKIIKEDVESAKPRVVGKGIMQTADEKNRNGRWYGYDDLIPQITAPRTLELLKAGYLRSENGHPQSKEIARQQVIDGTRCCARLLTLWHEGNDIYATFKGTYNALGDEFDMDLRDGCLPAWSLRALGTVKNTARGAEVKNVKLITYDNVIYPSHPNAYTKGIVSESASLNNKKLLIENSNLEKDKGILIPILNESMINYIVEESSNFKTLKESFDLNFDNASLIDEGHKMQLCTNEGNIFVANVEDYIHDEIMNYATRHIY